ncbi:MAG: serine/threonine protein kinase [Bradymonadaceae bacterium]
MDVKEVAAGEVLNETYELQRVLGEGALGRTYLATDLRNRRKVAIKELLPSRMKRWKDYELFHRECSTLRGLSHPGIPAYYEDFIIESDDPGVPARLFLVQSFIEGRTLEDQVKEKGVCREETARDIAAQVLDILDYLHHLNPPVIHRDIKPANLMLTPEGKVVLIDFGAVREAVTADGVGSTIVGTFGYMPPEQYAGQSVAATDLFALGATLVELLTARPAGELFEGLHVFKLPEDLPVTLGFERILLKMTEPEVHRRFGDAREVKEELERRFLMVPRQSITGSLPIPYEILPPPRSFPGFRLRDAYLGISHLAVLMWSAIGFLLSLAFPVAVVLLDWGAFVVLGGFVSLGTLAAGMAVSLRARRAISIYRRGDYTLGEVTGRFRSRASGSSFTHLTYRYWVGDEFLHGSISTRDRGYRTLVPGDPVGVLFLADDPEAHVMYAVPEQWSKTQSRRMQSRLHKE